MDVQQQGIPVTDHHSVLNIVAAASTATAPDRMPSFNWNPVYNRTKNSLFFVMMKSKGKEAEKKIKNLAEKAESMTKKEMREALKSMAFLSTGFVVGQIDEELVILTTLHSLNHIFTALIPITAKQIRDLFLVEVLCTHYEEGYRLAESKNERAYATARVLSVNCEKALVLLAVKRTDLKTFAGGSCPEEHSTLQLCASPDDPTEESLMVSWPAYKPNTISVGRIGVPRRIEEMNDLNNNKYKMKLLEIYMESVKGSAGAPLVNKSGHVIGMLHGGHGNAHSYFLCYHDLVTFLSRNLDTHNFPQPATGAEASMSSKLAD